MSEGERETIAARAGLGRPSGDVDAGIDLIAPPSLGSVRAYADLSSLQAGMETREAYRRYGSQSVALLEEALAQLETPGGGEQPLARATSSGQAALLTALTLVVTGSRKRVVVVRPCYGSTDALVAGPLGNLGVQLTGVDLPLPGSEADGEHAQRVEHVMGEDVAAVVAEVITNPLVGVVDIPAIAAVAHRHRAALIVDATFATPFLFRPFEHGADVVFHSLTKHLSGHSDVLGGVVLARADHPAGNWLDGFTRLLGCGLAPFDAWLALRGMRTAALRIERGSANAAALAMFFSAHERVQAVHYPGARGGCDAELAARLLPFGRGPMLSIELRGGYEAADAFLRQLRGVRLAPSLGDVATTVTHPASSSHRSLSREHRAMLGIGDGLVRISTGIEPVAQLQEEFDVALGGTM